MTARLVCGIDSSTQSTKVELRGVEDGTLVATGRALHPPTSPPVSEQDPGAWWDALLEALAHVAEHLGDVVAVAVAGQQHGLVVVDAGGRPVRNAKLWNDTTSAPQAVALTERLGAEAWARACGLVPVASITVTKLAWLAEHEPHNLARVDRVMLPHDYLTWRLCGEHVTDRGDASGTGWWSPRHGEYDAELLATAVESAQSWLPRLPRVLAPDEPAGVMPSDLAEELGLQAGVLVAAGTGDNMAAALGLGLRRGDVVVSLGTSGTVYASSDIPTADASGLVAGFADATGRYLPLVCTLNATKVTDMVGRLLGVDPPRLASLALEVPSDAALVLVPYLDGERSPNLPAATGLLTGLRTATTPADLSRAAHVGVLCNLLEGSDALCRAGVAVSGRRLLIGGGARSPAYRQLAADLWDHRVVVPQTEETVATGACVQAATVVSGSAFDEVTTDWGLGAGTVVEPSGNVDAAAQRAAYRTAASAAADLAAGPRTDSEV
ncbi:MAG: xylulokinase [Actinomycetota bacterium]|nr:xylulokinase [Euzebyaceae bacterium]MDQ3028925.1 xylulokinase [Actinomycetota bacterium]